MAQTPQFIGPDLLYRDNFIFSTTHSARFFSGTVDADTVDVQVSIRGAAFASDPDLVTFEGTSFTIPNPSAYPDGLQLFPGDNLIQIKSVLSNGSVTAPGKTTARLVQERDLQASLDAPTGISIERFDRTVSITVEGLSDDAVKGYHFYASVYPGGGQTGYSRVNPSLVISSESYETFDDLGELVVDADVATDLNGEHLTDPQYLRILGRQEDQFDTLLQSDFDQVLEIPEQASRLRTTTTVESVRQVQNYTFTHDRQSNFNSSNNPAIPNASFNAVLASDPLYYVATAIYYIEGIEYESGFSPEVSGAPLVITPSVGNFPTVSRQQVVESTVLSIYRSQPQIDVKPGSVIRDTFIDPFSTEAERLRFIVGFLHASQSFSTLLPIDDPGFTGTSTPVNRSAYKMALKQAFFLGSNASVQAIIDGAFDKLASNYSETRRPGRRARGSATIFTTRRPTTSYNFPIGTEVVLGGVTFRTTSPVTIAASGSGSFFNPATGRYSARVYIQAQNTGLSGNIAPSVGSVTGSPLGIQIQADAPTFGGQAEESNWDLARRAQGSLSSVDSGTLQGYKKDVVGVAGVSQVNIVEAGHPLMMRDVDSLGNHRGGKVDAWVRGEITGTLSDAFAFRFEIAEAIQFEVVGDPQNLRFRAVDIRLLAENPIIEMLSIPEYELGFTNQTSGHTFDLTDVEIVAYNSIQLSSDYNDPADIALTDQVTGSYRYRTSDKHVFTRQPVQEITSFEGQRSGVLGSTVYDLFRSADPLLFGRSNEAGDYLQVTSTKVEIPSPTPINVEGEQHVILDGIEYLNFLGANPLTVRIYNADRTVEYTSPYASASPDFTFIQGSATVALGIRTTATSTITEGQTVLIDYSHDENFSVEYKPNVLIDVTQETINTHKHITADVVTKEAIPVPVDITATVVLKNSQDRNLSVTQVDGQARTAISRFFGATTLGEPVRASDILRVLDRVSGVSYVVTPLTKMVKGNGALVLREPLQTSQNSDVLKVSAWSNSTVNVWLLKEPLSSATTNAGGSSTEHRGVFADEAKLSHYESAPNINGVPLNNQTDAAFIIGNGGLNIPGYSDDATLLSEYVFETDSDVQEAQLAAKRKELTQNRVLVTTKVGNSDPQSIAYTATYVVGDDEGVQNIDPGTAGYLTMGTINLTWDEDFNFQARVLGR